MSLTADRHPTYRCPAWCQSTGQSLSPEGGPDSREYSNLHHSTPIMVYTQFTYHSMYSTLTVYPLFPFLSSLQQGNPFVWSYYDAERSRRESTRPLIHFSTFSFIPHSKHIGNGSYECIRCLGGAFNFWDRWEEVRVQLTRLGSSKTGKSVHFCTLVYTFAQLLDLVTRLGDVYYTESLADWFNQV